MDGFQEGPLSRLPPAEAAWTRFGCIAGGSELARPTGPSPADLSGLALRAEEDPPIRAIATGGRPAIIRPRRSVS